MSTSKSRAALLAQIKESGVRGEKVRKRLHRANRADFAANTAEPQPNAPRKLGVDVRPSVARARDEDPEAFPGIGQPVEVYGDHEPKGGDPVTLSADVRERTEARPAPRSPGEPSRPPAEGASPPAKPKTPMSQRFLAKLAGPKEG